MTRVTVLLLHMNLTLRRAVQGPVGGLPARGGDVGGRGRHPVRRGGLRRQLRSGAGQGGAGGRGGRRGIASISLFCCKTRQRIRVVPSH